MRIQLLKRNEHGRRGAVVEVEAEIGRALVEVGHARELGAGSAVETASRPPAVETAAVAGGGKLEGASAPPAKG